MDLKAAAAAILVASSALADEGSNPGAWSGAYAGVTAGRIRSTSEADRGAFEGALLTLDVQNGLFPGDIEDADISAIGGVLAGYNHQHRSIVAGIELDLSLTNSDATADFSRIDPNPDPMFFGVNTNTSYETELDGIATARLRLGYALGDTLLYGTGGLALGQMENRFSLSLPELGYTSPGWSESGIRIGYVIGAGLEHKVTPRVRLRAELLHYDLGNVTVHAADPATFPGQTIDYEFDNSGMIGRVGVSFAF